MSSQSGCRAAGLRLPMAISPRKRSLPGLAERLVSLRKAAGLSQQVLATRAGISIPRLRDAERLGAATTETLTLIAKVLRTDVDTLLGHKGAA